jgi:hypothetical protein
MAQFITTTFAGGNDIALQLGNEEWVRKLAIGSSWTHVRIGVLYQLIGTGNTAGGTGLAIGMCSGTSNPFGSTSTTNFVGVEWINALTYVATGGGSPGYPYFQFQSTNGQACKKIVNTITTAGTNLFDGVDIGVPTNLGTTLRRGVMYIDITKGAPNYTIGISGPATMGSTSIGQHDFTVAELISGMTQTFGSITVGGFGMHSGNTPVTLACDEIAGGFDTVDVYINELNNPVNVYEVAVEKLA